MQEGRSLENLGLLLWSFVQRYGVLFNYHKHAVAVGQGGIVPIQAVSAAQHHGLRIAVEDPATRRCAWPSLTHLLSEEGY